MEKDFFELYIDFREWDNIFEIVHYRAKVGLSQGMIFIIHPNEQGHNEPHLHAKYQNKEAVINIVTNKWITGNLPKHKIKKAERWTEKNSVVLQKRWNELTNGIEIPAL